MKTYSQIEQFNKLAAALGSTYAAVRFITIKARTISSRYNYYVLDSEAISWVLSGEKPESAIRYEQELKQHKRIQSLSTKYILSVVDETLCYVEDESVCKSVRASIKASKEARHLVYVYIDLDDDYQHSRVRILTRMIWYSL